MLLWNVANLNDEPLRRVLCFYLTDFQLKVKSLVSDKDKKTAKYYPVTFYLQSSYEKIKIIYEKSLAGQVETWQSTPNKFQHVTFKTI